VCLGLAPLIHLSFLAVSALPVCELLQFLVIPLPLLLGTLPLLLGTLPLSFKISLSVFSETKELSLLKEINKL
jgi:hypothetical protein